MRGQDIPSPGRHCLVNRKEKPKGKIPVVLYSFVVVLFFLQLQIFCCFLLLARAAKEEHGEVGRSTTLRCGLRQAHG